MEAMRRRKRQSKKAEAVPAGDEAGCKEPDAVAEEPQAIAEVAEEPEAALWPEAGVKVAVGVEHLQHALRLGEKGVSEGLSWGFCSVILH